jgi:hypothetical protein
MKLLLIMTAALLCMAGPARADDKTRAAPPPAAKKLTPLAEELNRLRLDLSLALNKDHPIQAATRDQERAAVEKLLPIYERGLKLAADHPDAPEAKAALAWAANGFAAFPVTDRARQLFAAAADGLPAADRAAARLQLARSLESVAGQPWYSRAESARLTADADATLAAVLHDLDRADDARSKQLRQRAEDVRYVVRHLSVGQPPLRRPSAKDWTVSR